jgi:diguanylate cyclase (GGDEF)-like protein/PAS domain S-box-containing protein
VPAPGSPLDLAPLFGSDAAAASLPSIDHVLAHVPGVAVVAFDRDLRLVFAEGPAVSAVGFVTEAVRGRHLTEVVIPEARPILLPHAEAVLRGEPRRFEYECLVSEVACGVVAGPVHDDAGLILGGVALIIDITERLDDVQRLAEAEAHFRLLAETSTDVISLHDLDGTYRWISPSVRATFGYEPGELVGRTAFDFVHPEDAPGVITLLDALTRDTDTGVTTFRTLHADGSHVWVESSVRAIRDAATGQVTELRVASREIGARMVLERAERDANAELRRRLAQTAALARLGEFAVEERDPQRVMEAATEAVAETLEVPLTSVVQLDEQGGIGRAGVGWDAGLVGTRTVRTDELHSETLDLIAAGPLVLDDPAVETGAVVESLRTHGVQSTIAVLIGERERPWGLLSAHTREPRDFDAHDRDFLQSMAHVVADSIERHRAEEAARYEALHDRTTGLPNRALLVDRLSQALTRRREPNAGRVGVFFLDLDDFKLVNDSLGHEAGDDLLHQVGPRLQEVLRPRDTVARFGGDSFAVLCEEVRDEADALCLAERLIGAFSRPFLIAQGVQHFVTASIGVVVAAGGECPEDLLRDADAAMYRAKDAGRSRYELFDPIMRQRALTRLRIEGELRRALRDEELRLHFQPIWSLPGRSLAGVEALVRWEHPERRLVPPGEFIPVAEASGLIVPLGCWVLREACRQLAEWTRRYPESAELRMTINLSAKQVARPELLVVVKEAVEQHGIDPSRIGLEITEGLLMQDSASVFATLAGLKELGVRLILDDFGTGYSSLSYLKRFPIDQLKIDRSFVDGIATPGDDRAIVEAIVGMARALGLDVIPEGVETEEQLAVLESLGCDYAQGFLLGRPMPPEQLAELLPGA